MQVTETHVHGGTLTKVKRYGWQMADCPGLLQMVNKKRLSIDPDYQRQVNTQKVRAIAQDWSWIACGAIIVACRDKSLYVVDGQHRVMAARSRADISELPCVIFETAEMTEEARGFLRANTNRKPLTTFDKFRALLADNNPAAVFVSSLIDASGRGAWDTHKGSVRCLTLLMLHAERNPDILGRVWPLVDEICVGRPIHNKLIDALLFIESRMPEGESILDRRWKKRLLDIGYDDLLSGALKAAAFYERGGAKVWATGVLSVVNKGLRNNKLRISGLDAEQ